MDRDFHNNDFERLLREKSDEFRMYPSKRIWHSIYNNIHPGRKWPSVAMSITLITALLLMGYLNTNNTNNANLYTVPGKNIPQQKIIAQIKSSQPASKSLVEYPGISNEIPSTTTNNKNWDNATNGPNSIINKNVNTKLNTKSSAGAEMDMTGQTSISDVTISAGDGNNSVTVNKVNNLTQKETVNAFTTRTNPLPGLAGVKTEAAADDNSVPGNDQCGFLTYAQKTPINEFIENVLVKDFGILHDNNKNTINIQGGNSAVEKNNLAVSKKDLISTEDKNWIENYALYNRPATKKWANKLAWQIYATPSVVYRSLYNDPNFGNTNATPLAISAFSQDINKSVIQKPSLGFEIGTGFQYSVSKWLKLKAGLQLNYTRYNSQAFQNTHPVATKLIMHDYETNVSYEVSRTTPYSNKNGLESVKLHNETFQLSLPVGADLKLIGNENLQWNFGITIQPTYVPAGKSYLISSDRRNYVKETSMLNRWNLNAGFETFISYKTDNGITWQIGPQFRTQLYSTNNKQIAVQEKLLNYGLKFGISKTIK